MIKPAEEKPIRINAPERPISDAIEAIDNVIKRYYPKLHHLDVTELEKTRDRLSMLKFHQGLL